VYPGILHALYEARKLCFFVLCKLTLFRSLTILGCRVETRFKIRNGTEVLHLENLTSGLCRRFVISFGTAAHFQEFGFQIISSHLSRDFNGVSIVDLTNRKLALHQLQGLLALRYG
jgi:hypothetical protein